MIGDYSTLTKGEGEGIGDGLFLQQLLVLAVVAASVAGTGVSAEEGGVQIGGGGFGPLRVLRVVVADDGMRQHLSCLSGDKRSLTC